MPRKTTVSIHADAFHINGKPTYPGRVWEGRKIEGLLLNSRMVQATFDDLNPESRALWNYPDGVWDPDRNTREFIAQLPRWRADGLTGITVNFQGGSPTGYTHVNAPTWDNTAFTPDGDMRTPWFDRMDRVLTAADEAGMAVILGYFYFGQEPKFTHEAAILKATDSATDWICERGFTNVLVEVNNECNVIYKHPISRPERVHELIRRVQTRSAGRVATPAGRLLVSTSYGGGTVPGDTVAAVADFMLIHGNGVSEPRKIAALVDSTRGLPSYRGQPVVINEDDHFNFDAPDNNFIAAVDRFAGWGYFDYRMKGEGFEQGYQSVPVDWTTNSDRKRGFFKLLKRMTGA